MLKAQTAMQIETPPSEKPYDKAEGERRGLVIVNTGDGKGKSTAAFGLAFRALGRGKAVKVFQFMKVPTARFGEHRLAERVGLPVEGLGDGFSWKSKDLDHSAQLAREGWDKAKDAQRDRERAEQEQIDLMNQAILKNTLASATPRFFVRSDGAVNENEYADWTRPFVHTNGNLGSDSIAPIQTAGLDSVYVAVLQNKIAEMKETAGNRDVMSGGTAGGVTAATAIAALQEAGGKLSRNMIDDGYEAFSQVLTLCIELVRQFYDMPRQFRLLGKDGGQFAMFDNRGLQPRPLLTGGYRVPEFDLEVTAQDETPYQTMEYNQLALQLFQMGFFRSDMAEQALRCLELMQFRNKETLTEVIRQGQKETEQKEWLTASLRQAVALLDKAQGTHLSETLERELRQRDSGGGKTDRRVNGAVERQRQATRQAVRPR